MRSVFLVSCLACLACLACYGSRSSADLYDERDRKIYEIVVDVTDGRIEEEKVIRGICESILDIQYSKKAYNDMCKTYSDAGETIPVTEQEFVDAKAMDLVPVLSLAEYRELLHLLKKNKIIAEHMDIDLPSLYKEYDEMIKGGAACE